MRQNRLQTPKKTEGGLVASNKTSQLLCYKELGWGCLCLADSNNKETIKPAINKMNSKE